MAQLLLGANATVTTCHSRTRDLAGVCARADVLIAAVGRPKMVGLDWVKPGAIVIDVGVNRLESGLVGDVDFDAVLERAGAITPVPGGVGPMTIACLLRNTVLAPNGSILMPPETSQLDWEIELAAVIGTRCRRITAERALDAVAGYSIVNDVSARDLNMRSDYPFKFDWFQGKCHDTFAPFGPWIVPAWQIPDPQKVALRLDVNDQPMQQDTTANMIWTVREQIAYLSTIVTLEPGDVIATGTPTGVGMGRGIFLKAGDRIAATIDGIGTLANDVRAETIRT